MSKRSNFAAHRPPDSPGSYTVSTPGAAEQHQSDVTGRNSFPFVIEPSVSQSRRSPILTAIQRTYRSLSTGSADYLPSGTCSSEWVISSIETSRNVNTLALFTNRAGRYMSHTQASAIDTS